jgi:hypothetical protein
MTDAEFRELSLLLAIESRARAREDCHTCVHSIGADLTTGQKLREAGYSLGTGAFRHGIGLICERHRVVAPVQCADYERIPGPDQPQTGEPPP